MAMWPRTVAVLVACIVFSRPAQGCPAQEKSLLVKCTAPVKPLLKRVDLPTHSGTCRVIENFIKCVEARLPYCRNFIERNNVLGIAADLKVQYCVASSKITTTPARITEEERFDVCRDMFIRHSPVTLAEGCRHAITFLDCGKRILGQSGFSLGNFHLHAELLRNQALYWRYCKRPREISGSMPYSLGAGVGQCPLELPAQLQSCLLATRAIKPGNVESLCSLAPDFMPCLSKLANGCFRFPELQAMANFLWSTLDLTTMHCKQAGIGVEEDYAYNDYDTDKTPSSNEVPMTSLPPRPPVYLANAKPSTYPESPANTLRPSSVKDEVTPYTTSRIFTKIESEDKIEDGSGSRKSKPSSGGKSAKDKVGNKAGKKQEGKLRDKDDDMTTKTDKETYKTSRATKKPTEETHQEHREQRKNHKKFSKTTAGTEAPKTTSEKKKLKGKSGKKKPGHTTEKVVSRNSFNEDDNESRLEKIEPEKKVLDEDARHNKTQSATKSNIRKGKPKSVTGKVQVSTTGHTDKEPGSPTDVRKSEESEWKTVKTVSVTPVEKTTDPHTADADNDCVDYDETDHDQADATEGEENVLGKNPKKKQRTKHKSKISGKKRKICARMSADVKLSRIPSPAREKENLDIPRNINDVPPTASEGVLPTNMFDATTYDTTTLKAVHPGEIDERRNGGSDTLTIFSTSGAEEPHSVQGKQSPKSTTEALSSRNSLSEKVRIKISDNSANRLNTIGPTTLSREDAKNADREGGPSSGSPQNKIRQDAAAEADPEFASSEEESRGPVENSSPESLPASGHAVTQTMDIARPGRHQPKSSSFESHHEHTSRLVESTLTYDQLPSTHPHDRSQETGHQAEDHQDRDSPDTNDSSGTSELKANGEELGIVDKDSQEAITDSESAGLTYTEKAHYSDSVSSIEPNETDSSSTPEGARTSDDSETRPESKTFATDGENKEFPGRQTKGSSPKRQGHKDEDSKSKSGNDVDPTSQHRTSGSLEESNDQLTSDDGDHANSKHNTEHPPCYTSEQKHDQNEDQHNSQGDNNNPIGGNDNYGTMTSTAPTSDDVSHTTQHPREAGGHFRNSPVTPLQAANYTRNSRHTESTDSRDHSEKGQHAVTGSKTAQNADNTDRDKNSGHDESTENEDTSNRVDYTDTSGAEEEDPYEGIVHAFQTQDGDLGSRGEAEDFSGSRASGEDINEADTSSYPSRNEYKFIRTDAVMTLGRESLKRSDRQPSVQSRRMDGQGRGAEEDAPWGPNCSRPWDGQKFCTNIVMRTRLGNIASECRSLYSYITCLSDLIVACEGFEPFTSISDTVDYVTSRLRRKCLSRRLYSRWQ